MTIAQNTSGDAATTFGANTGPGWTNAWDNQGDLLMVSVGIGYEDADNDPTWQYNAVSMTLIGAYAGTGSQHNKAGLFYLASPATGSNNLVGSWASGNKLLTASISSWDGVDTGGTPFGTSAQASGSSTTISTSVSSASGEVVIDAGNFYVTTGGRTLTVGASQTQISQGTSAADSSLGNRCGQSTEPGAASVTMSWTISSSSAWTISAVPMKPAAGAAADVAETRGLGRGLGRGLARGLA